MELFVLDLDGTALLDYQTLHPRTIEAVKYASEKGHKVCIATGRNYCAAINFYKQLDLDTYLITSNGASVTLPSDSAFAISHPLKLSIVQSLIQDGLKTYLANAYYHTMDYMGVHEHHDELVAQLFSTQCAVEIKDLSMIDHDIFSITMIAKPDKTADLVQFLSNYDVEINQWVSHESIEFIEIMAKGCDKLLGVQILQEKYGISNESTHTLGDGGNDIGMVTYASNGVAMANACEELKAVANHVLSLDNTQGAVGEYIFSVVKK